MRASRVMLEGRLRVTGLTKRYGATTVLDRLRLTTPDGPPLVLRGGNGTGRRRSCGAWPAPGPLDGGEVLLDG